MKVYIIFNENGNIVNIYSSIENAEKYLESRGLVKKYNIWYDPNGCKGMKWYIDYFNVQE